MVDPGSVLILTGGTSKRMGRDKASVDVGGRTLLECVCDQVPENFPLLIAGDPTPVSATYIREEPVGSGPVAAVAAALPHVRTPVLYVIAVDTPFGVSWLLDQQLPEGVDAVIPRSIEMREHYLCAAYRTDALRNAISQLETVENASMRSLIQRLGRVAIVDSPSTDELQSTEVLLDVNSPADLDAARAIAARIWGGLGRGD